MRVFIGGVPYTFPARWYWAAPGARLAPEPHGCEASPWLSNDERNDTWGEITPFPTDRDSDYSRGVDRGVNPGYPGQCIVGEPSWFVDGQLPAGILDTPPPPMPPCCMGALTTGVSSGGLALGGAAVPKGRSGWVTLGGLALGGSSVPTGSEGAVSMGGLVLGGSARVGADQNSRGGLVLGGTGIPSSASGGDCTDAILITIGQSTSPRPFATQRTWYKVYLTAGVRYNANITGNPATVPAYWFLASGTCDNLNPVANDGYDCVSWVQPSTGWCYVYVFAQMAAAGTWTFQIGTGDCPP